MDRYRMWAALTALTQEVKLQGRSFKQLSDTLARETAKPRSRKEVLDGLLELRERLLRGVEAAGRRAKECSRSSGIASFAGAGNRSGMRSTWWMRWTRVTA